ncbi:MAG: NAD(P)-binding domain-containing protein [Gammaproteobacteria bacterium]|nr:NAD(P)-binding domain-containing protein [Gammaproteobacteria bacterium]MCY4218813.1 NAD(P)-binding domain-containing protein [Gammaproteobacteria bacterium]MCY4274984.1 NAD(P)-binding domain-containing protein [Gammaproteobacteria bacterium]
MKILIADSFPASHSESLVRAGHELTIKPELDGGSLPQAIQTNEILIVRSTRIDENTLKQARELKLIIRAGAGTNTIDKECASSLDISVCNVPGANSRAVAELVMGLILSIDRQIPSNVMDAKQGLWNKKKYSTARGLAGQKLGILGMGAIGFAVAERARGFAMGVYALSKPGRSPDAENRITSSGIIQLDTQDELLKTSDIVTLHMPATETTRRMVNREFLSKMKRGAMLINTSRGDLVDEEALVDAMNSRGIRAGLDVYNNEPGASENTFKSQVFAHPSVYGTHHIGASTEQAQIAVADGVLAIVEAYINGKLINQVN